MVKISVDNLWFKFPDSERYIFRSFSWEFNLPLVVGFLGTNGSGKTTLIRLLTGILSPTRGTISLNGITIKNMKSTQNIVNFVPENARLFLRGPTLRKELIRIFNQEKLVDSLIQDHKFEKIANRRIYQLSEGQRRLSALFVSFQLSADILFFDEPSIGLDTQGRDLFLSLANEATKKGKLIIISTNDPRLLPRMDHLVVIRDGTRYLEGGVKDILYRLESETKGELVPNQIVRLLNELSRSGFTFPKCITAREINEKLIEMK